MRDRVKLGLALAGLVLTGAAVKEASAGNLAGDITNAAYRNYVAYWSVSLNMGQWTDYNGPPLPQGAVLLLDDITYAMDLEPTDVEERFELFDIGTVFVDQPQVDIPFTNGVVSNNSYTIGWDPSYFGYLVRWARARGTTFRATVVPGGFGSVGAGCDSIAHTIWGQILGREKVDLGPWDPYAFSTVSLSSWCVPTSQSRHYQTPEIIQIPLGINFNNDVRPVTGVLSVYKFGRVHLKGRLFIPSDPSSIYPVLEATQNMRITP